MNQEAHELAGVLGSPFLSVSEGRGSSLLSLIIPLGFFLTRKTVEEERKKQYQQWAHLAPPGMGGPPGGRPGAGAPAGLPAGSPQDAGPGGGGSKGLELEFAPGNGRS